MSAMTSLRSAIPAGPWTVDDLDDFPEGDTTRYELIDGALLVSAEPSLQHQRVSAGLLRLLQDSAPPAFEVLLPVDVRLSPSRQLVPDLVVVPRQARDAKRVDVPPLLAVEVQSPSTRAVDLTLKRQVLQEAGVASYWLVEPFSLLLTVLELDAGSYVERFRGAGPFEVERPFRVVVDLRQLRS